MEINTVILVIQYPPPPPWHFNLTFNIFLSMHNFLCKRMRAYICSGIFSLVHTIYFFFFRNSSFQRVLEIHRVLEKRSVQKFKRAFLFFYFFFWFNIYVKYVILKNINKRSLRSTIRSVLVKLGNLFGQIYLNNSDKFKFFLRLQFSISIINLRVFIFNKVSRSPS